MDYELVKVESEADWKVYHKIRREVLWEARGRTGYDDEYKDEYLASHYPLLLKFKGDPVGTTRLDDFGNATGAVRLVAIVQNAQRQGHGRKLAGMVESYALQLGIRTLFVNAAPDALGYYEKLGWEYFIWDPSELTGIVKDCVQMRKLLLAAPAPRGLSSQGM